MKVWDLERSLEREKKAKPSEVDVEAEKRNLIKVLMGYPEEEQCAESCRWMKSVLITRKRLSKITQIPIDLLVRFHGGDYTALTEDQIKRVLYLVTFDRKALKAKWGLKKVHDRRLKRYLNKQKRKKLKKS